MSTTRDDAEAVLAPARGRTFARAYAVAAVPLVLLFLPLLAHRSDSPAILGFSRDYAVFLALTAVGIALLSLLVAAVCARTHTLLPAFSFLVGLLAFVGACLVVEAVLTYRLRLEDAFAEYSAWGHKRSLLSAFEATPNHTWTNAGATYTTDRLGFRTHLGDGPVEGGTGRTRIFTLGESSVFGYGLNDDETWPHLLEGRLRQQLDDPSLLVVNAGNNGHTSLQTLLRFYTKVLPLAPSHVVLYLGPNDIYGTGPDRLLISEEILFSDSVAQYWDSTTRGLNPYARSLLFYVVQQRVPALAAIMRGRKADVDESSDAALQAAANWNGPREKEIIGRNYLENAADAVPHQSGTRHHADHRHLRARQARLGGGGHRRQQRVAPQARKRERHRADRRGRRVRPGLRRSQLLLRRPLPSEPPRRGAHRLDAGPGLAADTARRRGRELAGRTRQRLDSLPDRQWTTRLKPASSRASQS